MVISVRHTGNPEDRSATLRVLPPNTLHNCRLRLLHLPTRWFSRSCRRLGFRVLLAAAAAAAVLIPLS